MEVPGWPDSRCGEGKAEFMKKHSTIVRTTQLPAQLRPAARTPSRVTPPCGGRPLPREEPSAEPPTHPRLFPIAFPASRSPGSRTAAALFSVCSPLCRARSPEATRPASSHCLPPRTQQEASCRCPARKRAILIHRSLDGSPVRSGGETRRRSHDADAPCADHRTQILHHRPLSSVLGSNRHRCLQVPFSPVQEMTRLISQTLSSLCR